MIRGLLLMVSVVAMFVLGLLMQGRIYKPNGGNILNILRFIGDMCAEECTLCVARSISAMVWSRLRPAELHLRRRRVSHRNWEKAVMRKFLHLSTMGRNPLGDGKQRVIANYFHQAAGGRC